MRKFMRIGCVLYVQGKQWKTVKKEEDCMKRGGKDKFCKNSCGEKYSMKTSHGKISMGSAS